jgi:hypothetical protein
MNGTLTWRHLVIAALALLALAGCGSSADTVSRNLSTEADEFRVERKIVGINTETDTVLFEITGLCSITRDGDLVVVCRKGPNEYEKHYLGLSPQTTFISTQLRTLDVDRYSTKIVFRPTTIVPDFDLSVGEQ